MVIIYSKLNSVNRNLHHEWVNCQVVSPKNPYTTQFNVNFNRNLKNWKEFSVSTNVDGGYQGTLRPTMQTLWHMISSWSPALTPCMCFKQTQANPPQANPQAKEVPKSTSPSNVLWGKPRGGSRFHPNICLFFIWVEWSSQHTLLWVKVPRPGKTCLKDPRPNVLQ